MQFREYFMRSWKQMHRGLLSVVIAMSLFIISYTLYNAR